MSEVLASKRKESKVEFIETARKLEIMTITKVKHFPRRYSNFRKRLEDYSINIYNNCKLANSVFIKTEKDIEKREKYFLKALDNLYILSSQLDIVKELNLCGKTFTVYSWKSWFYYILQEIKLIKAVLDSDKQRIEKKTD
mgnify:CR=1 FL=1